MKRSTKITTTGSDISVTICTVYGGLEILFGHSHCNYLVIHHLSVFSVFTAAYLKGSKYPHIFCGFTLLRRICIANSFAPLFTGRIQLDTLVKHCFKELHNCIIIKK